MKTAVIDYEGKYKLTRGASPLDCLASCDAAKNQVKVSKMILKYFRCYTTDDGNNEDLTDYGKYIQKDDVVCEGSRKFT